MNHPYSVMSENKLIPIISGYVDYARVYAQTHVFKLGVCKGSQWVLFVATVLYLYIHKGHPCVQKNKILVM